MMVTTMSSISPSSNPDPSLLSPSILDPEDNIVLKPINVAESNDKMSAHPRFWCGVHENGSENSKDVYNYGIPSSDKNKTPMCQIAELARFHKLKHEYQLMDESGPAHKKLFTVQLVLTPTQIFEGSGASIKKAQQSAAAEALRLTILSKPPEKSAKKQKRNGDPSSPCVLLSHVCRRLKMIEPVYTMNSFYPPRGMNTSSLPTLSHYPSPPAMMTHYAPLTPKSIVSSPPSIFASSPHSPHSSDSPCYLLPGGGLRPKGNIIQTINAPTHMCTIVMASHPPVHAVAESKQEARHKAATQALCLLGPALAMLEQKMKEEKEAERGRKKEINKENIVVEEGYVTDHGPLDPSAATVPTENPGNPVETTRQGEGEEEESRRKKKSKSVISQVHECALQMKLTVEFEVISEEGRAHDRSYVVECRLLGGEKVLQARGSGRQKREAKQAACSELIETLKKMESSPIHIATILYKSQRKTALPPPKEPKRKTIVKHMKMDPSYGHQINPVSRLIQVLQARGEPDPVFEFLGEAGQYKYKQFNVQVVVGDLFAEGAGPNKRLAKRAAAELMLELMGVAKRMPEPGKSLLKKRDDDQSGGCAMMSIGVFNPADLLLPPAPPPKVEVKEEKKARKKGGIMWAEDGDGDEDGGEDAGEKKEQRRRVTFNAQVAACTAPDDHAYPMTEVAPLKADDLGCAGKARRRGREGRIRSLNDTQKMALGRAVVAWIEGKEEPEEEDNVFRIESVLSPPTGKSERSAAKAKLDKLGTQFGFNPHYTIFPQGESANISPPSSGRVSSPAPHSSTSSSSLLSTSTSSASDAASSMTSSAAYFVIVNIPLSKAIMGEGHGETIDDAHEAAATDALKKIGGDTNYVPGLNNVPPAQAKSQYQQQQERVTTSGSASSSQSSPQHHHSFQNPLQHQLQMLQKQQPNPYYNANFGGLPPTTSPSSTQQRPMQAQSQLQSPVHKEHLQYLNRTAMTGIYPPPPLSGSGSPYELPTMADFYGQFDGSAYGAPSQSTHQRQSNSQHYKYEV